MVEEIGGGEALTTDILPSERKFYPTQDEYIRETGVFIKQYKAGSNTSGVFYTVPDNHVLYLQTATITAYGIHATATGQVYLYVDNLAGTDNRILNLYTGSDANNAERSGVVTDNYLPLIKFEEGTNFGGFFSSTASGIVIIKGFLMKKPIS